MKSNGTLIGHKDSVNCVRVNEKEHRLVSGSDDSTCRVWDLRQSKTVQCVASRAFEGNPVLSVDHCVQNPHLVFASAETVVYTFDLRKPDVVFMSSSTCYDLNQDEINQIQRHPRKNSPYLAAADDQGDIAIIDIEKGNLYKKLKGAHTNICSTVQFRPKASWDVVSGGLDSKIIFW